MCLGYPGALPVMNGEVLKVIALLLRVCTVSVETMKIVRAMPA